MMARRSPGAAPDFPLVSCLLDARSWCPGRRCVPWRRRKLAMRLQRDRGGPAVMGLTRRPVALRPRLSTGLPFTLRAVSRQGPRESSAAMRRISQLVFTAACCVHNAASRVGAGAIYVTSAPSYVTREVFESDPGESPADRAPARARRPSPADNRHRHAASRHSPDRSTTRAQCAVPPPPCHRTR